MRNLQAKAMKLFVPFSDDAPYEAGAQSLKLVPYQVGLPCHHAMGDPGLAVSAQLETQRWNSSESPGLKPSLSAVPPLSSSTYMAGQLLG
jgi:hypothetical protein